jgi:tetratricopeptide (TPR) repeat protein
VALCAAAVLLTGVRGGWFAVGVALLSVAVLGLLGSKQRSTFVVGFRSWVAGPGKAIFAAAVAIGVVAVVVLGPALMRRITAGGEDLRETFYRIALQMFGEAPVLGVGPGEWVAKRISYTLPSEVDHYVPHAHDLYLQGLAEMGVVGLLAALVVVGLLAWLLRDALWDEDPARRRWGWVATFTTIYFAAHHLVDFYVNAPTTLLAFAIPIALVDATATRSPARLPSRLLALDSRRALVIGAVVLAAAVAAAVAFEVPALRHAQAVKLANQGHWSDAYPLAQSAAVIDRDMPIYEFTAGLAAAHAGQYAEAASDLRRIAEAGDLPEAWLDLADAEVHLGDEAAAHDALERALRLGDQRGAVAVPGADLALRLGDDELETRTITRVLVFLPSLAEDPWWRAEPARAAAFDRALTAASASGGPGLAWELALLSGDSDAARTAASQLPEYLRAGVLDVIAAWTGDPGAVRALEDRCSREPLDWPVLWCARVSAKFDTAQADRYRAWGRIVGFDDELLGEIRVEPDPTILAVAGDPSYLYGVQAYRRFIPWDIVAPGLIHLTLQ